MKLEEIIAMSTDYREDNRIKAYVFGHGKKAAAIIGAMRGNEYQQLYICSQLIRILTRLEERGAIVSGKQIMVIPSLNAHSSNIGKNIGARIIRILIVSFREIRMERQPAGLRLRCLRFAANMRMASSSRAFIWRASLFHMCG